MYIKETVFIFLLSCRNNKNYSLNTYIFIDLTKEKLFNIKHILFGFKNILSTYKSRDFYTRNNEKFINQLFKLEKNPKMYK